MYTIVSFIVIVLITVIFYFFRFLYNFRGGFTGVAKTLNLAPSLLGMEFRIRTILIIVKNARPLTKFKGRQWKCASAKFFINT